MIDASGERRSCDTDDSNAERRRSVSPVTRASSRSDTRLRAHHGFGDVGRHRFGETPHFRGQARYMLGEAQADHALGLAVDDQRQEPPIGVCERVGEAARGLLVLARPVGGGAVHCADGERALLRQRIVAQVQQGIAVDRTLQGDATGFDHLADIGSSGELPAQRLQRGRMRVRCTQGHDLRTQFRGQAAGDQRGDQEQEHRRHALARADVEGVARFDEEEVVGEEAQRRGDHRGRHARARGDHHHRDDEHHRQVFQPREALQQPAHAGRHCTPRRTTARRRCRSASSRPRGSCDERARAPPAC